MSINKVILSGFVGSDPDVKVIKENKVANFSMATSETYKNKSGEKVTNTEWHNLEAWKGLAGVIESYVKKGSEITIQGKLKTKSYEIDGKTKYYTFIEVKEMTMHGNKTATNTQPEPNNQQSDDNQDEDLPF
jgi:single-strand DNA-binding protein